MKPWTGTPWPRPRPGSDRRSGRRNRGKQPASASIGAAPRRAPAGRARAVTLPAMVTRGGGPCAGSTAGTSRSRSRPSSRADLPPVLVDHHQAREVGHAGARRGSKRTVMSHSSSPSRNWEASVPLTACAGSRRSCWWSGRAGRLLAVDVHDHFGPRQVEVAVQGRQTGTSAISRSIRSEIPPSRPKSSPRSRSRAGRPPAGRPAAARR